MYRTNITEQNNFSLIESDGDTPDGDEKEEQKKRPLKTPYLPFCLVVIGCGNLDEQRC